MRILRTTALAAAIAATPGCGWLMGEEGIFRDRSEAYREARLEERLIVPEGLSDGRAIDDAYPIPEVTETASLSGDFEVPRPDPLEGDPSAQLVKIQRLGTEQWILVEASPGQVWPQVRGFLNRAQLPTDRIDPELGLIETDWLQPAGARAERYRMRIEQGVQRETSEVFVLHDLIGGEGWPASSEDPERENIMIQELSQFIADSSVEGVVSMVAERALDSRGKVFLRRDGGQPYLDLQLPFVRAWGALQLALEKAGLETQDLDRSEGRYWISARPEADAEKCGWFASLFGCGDSGDEEARNYVLDMQPAGAGAVTIRIRSDDGQPLAEQEAERMLTRIKGFVS